MRSVWLGYDQDLALVGFAKGYASTQGRCEESYGYGIIHQRLVRCRSVIGFHGLYVLGIDKMCAQDSMMCEKPGDRRKSWSPQCSHRSARPPVGRVAKEVDLWVW